MPSRIPERTPSGGRLAPDCRQVAKSATDYLQVPLWRIERVTGSAHLCGTIILTAADES